MGSTEKFLLHVHPEIVAELKVIPQVIIKHEEEVQANVTTRKQRLREEAEAIDNEEKKEDEENSENENESDEQSDEESRKPSDRIRQENDACERDNLLQSEDSDEDVHEGQRIANCKSV